jgi:non-ribosomal peptide synthase protein (TIGR01720 family)
LEKESQGLQTFTVPIGRPLPNVQAYLLDQNLQPVPRGVGGELYIGGDCLARGYLNRADQTAERFIPHPFSSDPGARLYKTGDLARHLSDGNIEFLGRLDQQVKIRGFRIELAEIEAALNQHPSIRECLVLARENAPGDKRLVAYIVAHAGHSPNSYELRSYLKETLPEHMIPAAFSSIDELPRTPHGKLDRSALPAPEFNRTEAEDSHVAAGTPAEEILVQIWRDVLGIKHTGIHDNFFELGGDSILSIQIITRARQAGLHLTPKQLFQHQSIAELAAVAGPALSVNAEQGAVSGPVPLTPIQHWFFERELAAPEHYNLSLLLTAREPLDEAALRRAVVYLLEQHDALRLRFTLTTQGWQQRNATRETEDIFSRIDLSHLSGHAPRFSALEAEAAKLQASLNLMRGPLARVALFDFGATEPQRLLLVVHHVAVDAISWRILLEDFSASYRQLTAGRAIERPRKTTSFKEWAERLSAHAQSHSFQLESEYWLNETRRGAARLSPDHETGPNDEASARSVIKQLCEDETHALLQELPHSYFIRINEGLLMALWQTLTQHAGLREVLVDVEGHGREALSDDLDVSRTIGWFTTHYPVRLKMEEGQLPPHELLKKVKQQLRDIPHHGMGYGLLRYLNRNGDAAQKLRSVPAPEILFNYLGQLDHTIPDGSPFDLAEEPAGPARDPRTQRSHLLEIVCYIRAGRLQTHWTYSKNLHRRSTIEMLAEGFTQSIRLLIEHSRSTDAHAHMPSDFPLAQLRADELEQAFEEVTFEE